MFEYGAIVRSGILNVTKSLEPGIDPGFGVKKSMFVTFQSLILYTFHPKIEGKINQKYQKHQQQCCIL